MQDVTVISCAYGTSHDRFIERWAAAVEALDPAPSKVVVSSDRSREIPGAIVPTEASDWAYPQAFHLTRALWCVHTEWVWIHDIDDVAFPDALEGLADIAADVWQLGYLRSDGETYLPPQLTAAEVLAAEQNPFVAGSCVRTETLWKAGGFPDIALQDWALWRALAHSGATFESSDRAHFHYMRHDETRGAVELTVHDRPAHLAEMHSFEERHALTI